MSHNKRLSTPKPYTVIGAGRLVSTVWKSGNERGGWRYRFNIYRMNPGNGQVSQRLRPVDVRNLVKLAQVLAAVLIDDGCIPEKQRRVLADLAAKLDLLNRSRS